MASRLRGPYEAGVRMSRVREASIGESSSDDTAAAAVAIKTEAAGADEVSIPALGMAPTPAGTITSASAMPMTAARSPRRKLSSVLDRTV